MTSVGLIIAAALLVSASAHAETVYTIRDDRGGDVESYRKLYAGLKAVRAKIVIDGVCASACGLVFGLINHNPICATGRAKAGFHRAVLRDGSTGQLLTSEYAKMSADMTTIELFTALPLEMQNAAPLSDWPDIYEGAKDEDAVWIGPKQMQQIFGKCK